jgi:predicted DNA-binding transcriptional regulator AlpA
MERDIGLCMKERLSTRQAAKKLGVTLLTLQRHVSAKTVAAPPLQKIGGVSVRLWTARDIQKARKVLAGIRPGRKKKA